MNEAMKVKVNGEFFQAIPMRHEDVRPGACIRWKENRRAFRIVCLDGDDAILRNMRKPGLLEAVPEDSIAGACWLLVPEEQRS